MNEIQCPYCLNDNPMMFTFSERTRHQVRAHCEVCSKDFTQKFDVPTEKLEIPTNEKPNS